MRTKLNIKIEQDNSKEVLNELDDALERALEKIGLIAEGHAKLHLTMSDAVDTGRLRNSISHATHTNAQSISYSWGDSTKGRRVKGGSDSTTPHGSPEKNNVVIGTNVEYAPYIELGTSNIAARPYLKPAIASNISKFKQIIEEELK